MTSLIKNNEVCVFSKEEKTEILSNAYTSFAHGVDHFSEYAEYAGGEKNIKFAILHIFNTIELLVKAYLGSINLYLLKERIDDGKAYGDEQKTAGITILLDRMKKFSDVDFETKLREKVEILRKKRNEIEHKKFIFENESDLLILMCDIINGLIVFSKNHIYFDILPDLLDASTKLKFHKARIKLDRNYDKIIKEVESLKHKGYLVIECPSCLNITLPYKRESKAMCFICNENFYIQKCHSCSNLCTDVQNGQGICNECTIKEGKSIINAFSSFEREEQDKRESLPKEDYK